MRSAQVVMEARCPNCGSEKTVPIFYGYPARERMKDVLVSVKRGEIEYGGPSVTCDDPTHHCKSCGHNFFLKPPWF